MRRPVGVAAIALLARARMQRDRLQTAILGQLRHLTATSSWSFQPARNFIVNGIVMAARTVAQNRLHQRQIAQQARAAVALHHLIHRAAEVDVDNVEAQVLADARRFRHHGRVGAEQLRGDGVLVILERQVAHREGLAGRAPLELHDAVRTGESWQTAF